MKYAVLRHRDGTLEILNSDLVKDWKAKQNILCEFESMEDACIYVGSVCRFFVINYGGEVMVVGSNDLGEFPHCTIIRGVTTLQTAKALANKFGAEI